MTSSIALIGAGLGALLTARALLERGLAPEHLTLFAPPARKASDAPGALMHPLPGTSLEPKPGVMRAYERSCARIAQWREDHPHLVFAGEMLRPERGGKRGRRYRNSYERSRADYAPHMHHEALDAAQAQTRCPLLTAEATGAIAYGPAYCVALGALIEAELHALLALGVRHLPRAIDAIHRTSPGWTLLAEDGTPHEAAQVVLSPGASLAAWFPLLPIGVNGGELLVVEPEEQVARLEVLVSGGGHIAPLPGAPTARWVMGSSYLRPLHPNLPPHSVDAFARPDDEASSQLRSLIGDFIPEARRAETVDLWRGVRCVMLEDKHPLAGPIPGQPGLFLLGALGSKGLLWAPALAEHLALQLTSPDDRRLLDADQVSIIEPCTTSRVPAAQYHSARIAH